MAGIYIHVPFCKTKCHYCDFHFSTNLQDTQVLVDSIISELNIRKNYLRNQTVETIYFGGGTPSILSKDQLKSILSEVFKTHEVSENPEITLEGNPDDLTYQKLHELEQIGINRLSIGIQSFRDKNLTALNRAHSASQSYSCLEDAKKVGFENITIDLIYGLPDNSNEDWEMEVKTFLELGIPHLSAYCLTIEPNTVFGHKHAEKTLSLPTEESSLEQFKYLITALKKHGFEQYEISNFSLPNQHSKHNSAYWMNEPYLGVGPSAHSYDGNSRSWNIAHNLKYNKAIKEGDNFNEREALTPKDQFNEYILTRIRTKWGINLSELALIDSNYVTDIDDELKRLCNENLLKEQGHAYFITDKGKFLSDSITARLFIE